MSRHVVEMKSDFRAKKHYWRIKLYTRDVAPDISCAQCMLAVVSAAAAPSPRSPSF